MRAQPIREKNAFGVFFHGTKAGSRLVDSTELDSGDTRRESEDDCFGLQKALVLLRFAPIDIRLMTVYSIRPALYAVFLPFTGVVKLNVGLIMRTT